MRDYLPRCSKCYTLVFITADRYVSGEGSVMGTCLVRNWVMKEKIPQTVALIQESNEVCT